WTTERPADGPVFFNWKTFRGTANASTMCQPCARRCPPARSWSTTSGQNCGQESVGSAEVFASNVAQLHDPDRFAPFQTTGRCLSRRRRRLHHQRSRLEPSVMGTRTGNVVRALNLHDLRDLSPGWRCWTLAAPERSPSSSMRSACLLFALVAGLSAQGPY